jgi:hypothetical protein
MFCLNKRPMLHPELSKYLRDVTNKHIEKQFKNPDFVREKNTTISLPKDVELISFLLLPVVSLLSFLAGYNYCKLKMITN